MPSSRRARVDALSGFTLLEILLVVSLLVVVAAMSVPMLSRKEEARVTRAKSECGRIAAALSRYETDTRTRPIGPPGGSRPALLFGDLGARPHFASTPSGTSSALRTVTFENPSNDRLWRGPYLEVMQPDPWGAAFVVLGPPNERPRDPVWILSAGPDGIVQTSSSATEPIGDDLGVRW